MAYVTSRKNGTWELRESISTPDGPRSRTLASFRTLSDEVLRHARTRATKPLGTDQVRDAAHRAGAPVDLAGADRAAGDLLRELADGHEPHPILRALLIDALQEGPPARLGESREPAPAGDALPFETPHNARASAAWLTRTPDERGAVLHDLLSLADHLPHGRRVSEPLGFPRLSDAA
ncbi:MAG TPA: hypothetical protein VHF90_04415 [Thermoleophilaceae bacterium]|nr:hypothetical protein [Thermoleophilaceae bacterium]